MKKFNRIIMFLTAMSAVLLLYSPLFSREILSLSITNLDESYAVIKWETDVPCTGIIHYGINPEHLISQSMSISPSRSHTALLNRLSPGTEYFFQLELKWRDNNERFNSSIAHFTTLGTPGTQLEELSVYSIERDRFSVQYRLNVPVYASIQYILNGETVPQMTSESGPFPGGIISVTNLHPESGYYYLLQYRDQQGNAYRSPVKQIKTLENNIALYQSVSGSFTNLIYDDPYYDKTPDPVQRITDGKIEYFAGMAVSGDIRDNDQVVIIDLGGSAEFSRFEIYWRALAYSTDFLLEVSKDAQEWKRIRSGLNGRDGDFIRGSRGDPVLLNTIRFKSLKARYIRLTAQKGRFFVKHADWRFIQLMEIKVIP